MKRTIPFNKFGENQELSFNIATLAEFERIQGKSIQQIAFSGNAGIDFCLKALPLCLKRINPDLYVKKIEKYLEEGGDIDDIATPIVHAIAATGVLGKPLAESALSIYYPELYNAPEEKPKQEEDEKNV